MVENNEKHQGMCQLCSYWVVLRLYLKASFTSSLFSVHLRSEYLFRYSPHAKTINHSNSNLSLPTQPEHTTHKNLKWFTRFQVSPCHGSTVPHMTPPKDVCKYLYARIPKRNPCFAKTKVGPFPAVPFCAHDQSWRCEVWHLCAWFPCYGSNLEPASDKEADAGVARTFQAQSHSELFLHTPRLPRQHDFIVIHSEPDSQTTAKTSSIPSQSPSKRSVWFHLLCLLPPPKKRISGVLSVSR